MLSSGPARASIPHGGTLAPKCTSHLSLSLLSSSATSISRSRLGFVGIPLLQDQRCQPRTVTACHANSSHSGPQEDNHATSGPLFGGHQQCHPADLSASGSNAPGSPTWPTGDLPGASASAAGSATSGQGPIGSPHLEDGQSQSPVARILVADVSPSGTLRPTSSTDDQEEEDPSRAGSQQSSSAVAAPPPVEPLLPPPQRPSAGPFAPLGEQSRSRQPLQHQQQTRQQGDREPSTVEENMRAQQQDLDPQQAGASERPAPGGGGTQGTLTPGEAFNAADADKDRRPTSGTRGPNSLHLHHEGTARAEDQDWHQGHDLHGQQPQGLQPNGSSDPAATSEDSADGGRSAAEVGPSREPGPGPGAGPGAGTGPLHLNGHSPLLDGASGPPAAPRPGPQQLPPLRLGFLDPSKWESGLQDWMPGPKGPRGTTGRQGPTGQRPGQRPGQTGARWRRGMSASGKSSAQTRDERIRQLVYAASTLIQLRSVCERQLPYMSAVTATVALSRLTTLTAATQRLQRAQMRPAAGASAGAPRASAPSGPPASLSSSPAAAAAAVASRPGPPETDAGAATSSLTAGDEAALGAEARGSLGEVGLPEARAAHAGDLAGPQQDQQEPTASSCSAPLKGADMPAAQVADPDLLSRSASAAGASDSVGPSSTSSPFMSRAHSTAGEPPAAAEGPRQASVSTGPLGASTSPGESRPAPSQAVTPSSTGGSSGGGEDRASGEASDSEASPASVRASPSAATSTSSSSFPSPPGTAALGSGPALGSVSPPRDQVGSIRLMRRLLRHIAFCLVAGSSGSPTSARGARAGGGPTGPPRPLSPGAVAAAAAPRHHFPPDHRARTAGNVLVTLARAGWRSSPEDMRALYDIIEAARPDLFLATPLQLARLATSLPTLRLRPSTAWLDHFAAVSRSKMYSAGPGQLAAFAWCLAKLRHNPGELWLYSLTDHLLRNRKVFGASASHLCQLLWALHQLGFTPDPDWRLACSQAVEAAAIGAASSVPGGAAGPAAGGGKAKPPGPPAPALQAGPVASMASGTAANGRPRGRGFGGASGAASGSDIDSEDDEMDAVVDEGEDAGNAPGHVASLLLWSVRTGTAPGPAALEVCLQRLQPQLRSLRRGQLLRLLLALSEGGHRPSEEFLGRTLSCLQPKLSQLNATHQLQVLLAVSQLRFVPSQPWLKAFLEASRAQLRNYHPAHITATYQVFAGWHLRPPRPYLEDLHTYTDNLLTKFPPRSLAAMLHSMSSLGVKPQRRWLARALDALADGIDSAAGPPRMGGPGVSEVAAADAMGLLARTFAPDLAPAGDYLALPGAAANERQRISGGSSSGSGSAQIAEFDAVGVGAEAASGPLTAQERRQLIHQRQRLTAAAALVAAVCSLRGIVQLDDERGRTAGASATGGAAGKLMLTAIAPKEAKPEAEAAAPGASEAPHAVAEAPSEQAKVPPAMLPYELWGGLKRLMDVCRDSYMDVLTAADLFKLIKTLARINFYPGREFLAAHSVATARAGAQLSPDDKEEVAACYGRLAALAPLMAAEAKRQAELRQARVSVLVGDPWAT